jgi:cysteinyl-tRNA synthetase
MSKSSGEFLTVSLLESKGYDPLVYRFFCLQSHYRKSLVFSYENLDNATISYNKLVAKIAQLDSNDGSIDHAALEELKAKFRAAMDNDLNTALAVTAVYDVLKAKTNGATKLAALADFDTVPCIGMLQAADKIRAAKADEEKQNAAPEYNMNDPLVVEILDLIEKRKQAKKEKNFAEADRIRQYLADKGVTLVDDRSGTTFKIG